MGAPGMDEPYRLILNQYVSLSYFHCYNDYNYNDIDYVDNDYDYNDNDYNYQMGALGMAEPSRPNYLCLICIVLTIIIIMIMIMFIKGGAGLFHHINAVICIKS